MLKYLNTRPRVTYLARIKNPNPKMPGADRVGLANGIPHHHGAVEHADIGPTHFDGHGVDAPASASPAKEKANVEPSHQS